MDHAPRVRNVKPDHLRNSPPLCTKLRNEFELAHRTPQLNKHGVVHSAACRALYNKESFSTVADFILKPSQSLPFKTDALCQHVRVGKTLNFPRNELLSPFESSPRNRVFGFLFSDRHCLRSRICPRGENCFMKP